MYKNIYYTVALFAALLATGCGESLEETYDEFAGDGMIRYVGKCSEVEVNPGWERLQVVWKHSIDAGVKNVKINWKSEKGNGEILADPYDADSYSLMDTLYLDNLEDAMYTVRVSNITEDGRESLVEEKYGRPYSFAHEDLRSFSRGITAFSRMGDKLAVMLDEDNENLKEMLLCFKDKTGQEQIWNIKEHMTDTLVMNRFGEECPLMRDYMHLLPADDGVEIDFSQPIAIKRKGKLQGCIDEIVFQDELLHLDERLWSTKFSQLMLGAYGEAWEEKMDGLEVLEMDYDMTSFQDLMYLPNLKKVILGKNRYMDSKYAFSDHSTTDEYVGLVILQFLKNTREEFMVERYNRHYFYGNYNGFGSYATVLKKAGKLTDLELEEKQSANLDEKPSYIPLDTTGWLVTCSTPDSVRDGYREYGAAWLLYDGLRTTVEENLWGEQQEMKEEMYFEPKQTLGGAIVTVTFDMLENRKVEGFKVGQVSTKTENKDRNYLLSSLMIEFSTDGIVWTNATYTDGSATIGNAIGEETFIPVPKDLQVPARYIRLTMSNRPVDDVSGQGLYSLRLAKFIPCTLQ